MPQRMKCRKVEFLPETDTFLPEGKQDKDAGEYVLKIEELEAMRLKDVMGLSQEACAEKMKVSRQTFQKIIDEARKKVALALIDGTGIRISGGSFVTRSCKIECAECKHIYEPSFGDDKVMCPKCGSHKIRCLHKNKQCSRLCWEEE